MQFIHLAKRLLGNYEITKVKCRNRRHSRLRESSHVPLVYHVWLQLFTHAVLGSELADNSTNSERGALLSELWQGKTDLLSTLATSSHGVLSNHSEYKEKDYANHVANTIMTASRFGVPTHPKQKLVKVSHVIPMR
ncbi:hypothetical protein EV175_007306 [Coemansia sp. RSA 1933]|nr:hypothetical protein EV175_007306 [Coemansia sp. RSA 1933]